MNQHFYDYNKLLCLHLTQFTLILLNLHINIDFTHYIPCFPPNLRLTSLFSLFFVCFTLKYALGLCFHMFHVYFHAITKHYWLINQYLHLKSVILLLITGVVGLFTATFLIYWQFRPPSTAIPFICTHI